MARNFNTYLFGDFRIAVARPATRGRGRFAHTFGGPHDRKGTSRDDCNGLHIHLLHRLDLTDPAIPFTIPGVRWLPFYYCFDFRVNDIGYRLISDDELVTYFPTDDPDVSTQEDWPSEPGEKYPMEFRKSDITIAAYDYDPTALADAERWAGVFGISKLSPRQQATAKRRVAEWMKRLDLDVPQTEEDFDQALSSPFLQGKPDTPCLNPKCSDRNRRGQLVPLALMPGRPMRRVPLFGEWSVDVQLIFRICPKCHTIRVSNQCD